MQKIWTLASAKILCLVQVRNFVVGGQSFVAGGPKLCNEVVGELLLGDMDKDHVLKGRVGSVVGGGLCLGLRGLEESHLNLNARVEELDWVFPFKGFCPG